MLLKYPQPPLLTPLSILSTFLPTQNLSRQDPVQSQEGKLAISTVTSVHQDNYPPSSKEGSIIEKHPELPLQVRNRLRQLSTHANKQEKFVPSGFHMIDRGQQEPGYFQFKITGIVYQGEWRVIMYFMQQGKPNGWGKCYFPNGGFYEGTFVDGVPNGCGRLIMPNGDYYDGDIKFGRANGNGYFSTKNGDYRGQFKDNVRHGYGVQRTSKMSFEGTFEYGQKIEGKMRFNQNDVYEGEFQDDVFSGKGSLKTSEGVYVGSFWKGLKHGKGEQKWPDGSYYQGSYYEGQREGQGEFINKSNSSISGGFWKNGTLQGQGYYIERGRTYKCVWSGGKLVGLRN